MNPVHGHLLLNHFPIVGSLLAIIILGTGLFKKDEIMVKISLYLFAGLALLTIPVFLSGEGAEEVMEHLPGMKESLIEAHEEAAETALWTMMVLGLMSLSGLFLFHRKDKKSLTVSYFILIVAMFTFFLMARAGNTGGDIRHPEIYQDNGH
jgi:uncharacterized membrane protein